jgi:hypothetical protein
MSQRLDPRRQFVIRDLCNEVKFWKNFSKDVFTLGNRFYSKLLSIAIFILFKNHSTLFLKSNKPYKLKEAV